MTHTRRAAGILLKTNCTGPLFIGDMLFTYSTLTLLYFTVVKINRKYFDRLYLGKH